MLAVLRAPAPVGLTAIPGGRCCHQFHSADEETGWEKLNNVPKVTRLVSGGAQPDQVGLTTCTRLHAKGQRWLKTDVPKGDRRFPTHAVSLKAGSMAGSVPCPR